MGDENDFERLQPGGGPGVFSAGRDARLYGRQDASRHQTCKPCQCQLEVAMVKNLGTILSGRLALSDFNKAVAAEMGDAAIKKAVLKHAHSKRWRDEYGA